MRYPDAEPEFEPRDSSRPRGLGAAGGAQSRGLALSPAWSACVMSPANGMVAAGPHLLPPLSALAAGLEPGARSGDN